jgi:HPt (histidine-containing phosphotransfer) domain-containing protein
MAGERPAAAWSGDKLSDEGKLSGEAPDIIDWVHFEKSRAELGPGFIRILNYFREDGAKSVAQIEQAMHAENATALVIPAHTLKGEARQFGAEPLAEIAELIETTARLCIETHRFPDELVSDVVELRRLFQETVDQFEKATNPLVKRAPAAFGRKAGNQDFGRL